VLSEIHTQSDEIPDKIPVLINGITTSKNRSQKISSRISEFKLGESARIKLSKQKDKKKCYDK
jgi:mannitol/fructose-specific phosphotransferase system IIA component (Ntr-type)